MYRGARVAVVVPAYNERDHVATVIETLPEFVDRAYVVDDGSTDDTWSVVRERADRCLPDGAEKASDGRSNTRSREGSSTHDADLGRGTERDDASDPLVVAVRHPENRGVGGAIKTGYRLAMADGMDAAAVMSGDAQMDPDYLDDVLDPVVEGRADYAKGTRLSNPEHVGSMSRWRRFGNHVLTLLTRISTSYWDVEDPQNGYTAISREAMARIRIDELYDRYGFANDLLAALSRAGMRVVDVPHPARYGDETSHIRYRTFVPVLSVLLLSNFVRRLLRTAAVRPYDPAVLGYAIGTTGFVLSGVFLGFVLAGSPSTVDPVPAWTVPATAAFASVFVGIALATEAREGTHSSAPLRGTTRLGDGEKGSEE